MKKDFITEDIRKAIKEKKYSNMTLDYYEKLVLIEYLFENSKYLEKANRFFDELFSEMKQKPEFWYYLIEKVQDQTFWSIWEEFPDKSKVRCLEFFEELNVKYEVELLNYTGEEAKTLEFQKAIINAYGYEAFENYIKNNNIPVAVELRK